MSMLELFLLPACFFAAMYDFLFYKIPNWLVLLVIGGFFAKSLFAISMGAPLDILVHPSITFLITLFIGFILFAYGAMGAGDAKLLAACSLWMADINPINFIMLVTISGGILALIYLIMKKPLDFIRDLLLSKIVNKFDGDSLIINEKNMVPYAIAILGGVVWMVLHNR